MQPYRKSNLLLIGGILVAAQALGFIAAAVSDEPGLTPFTVLGAMLCVGVGVWCIRRGLQLRP